jgi:hypothetical protein
MISLRSNSLMEALTRRNHTNPAKSNKILCLENLSSLRIGLEALKDLFDLDDFFAKQFSEGSARAQKSYKYFKSNNVLYIENFSSLYNTAAKLDTRILLK